VIGGRKVANADGSFNLVIDRPIAPVSTNPVVMRPFKIYNINNIQNPQLRALTFQIRGGIVAWRSNYFEGELVGNFEEYVFCGLDSLGSNFDLPPQPNSGPNIVLQNAADTLIFDSSLGLVQILPQIVLQGQFDGINQIAASFWLKIIDVENVGAFVQLWGRMYSGNVFDASGRPNNPFPAPDPSIIPIGTIAFSNGSLLSVQIFQYLWDNVLNRFLPTAPIIAPVNSPMQFRGSWTQDNLSGEIFYPGDLVTDDTAPVQIVGTAVSYYFVYSYMSDVRPQNQPPSTNPGSWRKTFSVFQ
jgi:hypothetical protein